MTATPLLVHQQDVETGNHQEMPLLALTLEAREKKTMPL